MPWLSKRSYFSLTHYPHNKQLLIKLRSHLVFSTTGGRWFLARATLWYDIFYACPFFHHPSFLFYFFFCVVSFLNPHIIRSVFTHCGDFFVGNRCLYIYFIYMYKHKNQQIIETDFVMLKLSV